MKRFNVLFTVASVLVMVLTSPLMAFEGIITMQETEHEGVMENEMFGGMMQEQMEAQQEQAKVNLEAEIRQMKDELKTATGDDKEWLSQDIKSMEAELTALNGDGESTSTSKMYVKGMMYKVVETDDGEPMDIIFKADQG